MIKDKIYKESINFHISIHIIYYIINIVYCHHHIILYNLYTTQMNIIQGNSQYHWGALTPDYY